MDLKGYHCLADLFGKLNSQEKLEDDFTTIPEGGKLKFFWEKCGHEKIDASSIIERTKQKIRRDVMRRRRNYFLVASASVAASILICISTIHFLTHCENTNLDFQAIAEQMDSQSVEEVTLITAKEQLNLDEDAFVTYSKEGKVAVNSKVIREKEEKKVKGEPEYNQLLVPAGKRVRVELSDGTSTLSFGFPYREAPKTYIRKLTLAPEVTSFQYLKKGETVLLTWEFIEGQATDYSDFICHTWEYCYDTYRPQPVKIPFSPEEIKGVLSNYFVESFVGDKALAYYSSPEMKVAACANMNVAEIGFVGRVLLNAFNAWEFGNENGRDDLAASSKKIFDSYLENGFTETGYLREWVNLENDSDVKEERPVHSIRRQSEGIYAMFHYLNYEQKYKRHHPDWEQRLKKMLDMFLQLQNPDGSFPRKFHDDFTVVDGSGGSTPSATLPLVMGYKYFKDKRYLSAARRTAEYLEKELISKADYFSSTLDANCEDKEASLYTAMATYYLSLITNGTEHNHYASLTRKAAYFALSWYYVWDVPFAPGQMLGDIGLKTRGWGNVSVENNHIDVFIFEFADVLRWLSKEYNEPRFSDFAEVISTSMCQLLPYKGHMCGVIKVGYYPEVIQHTNWDYGRNGKGYYNDMFAPGWTVASLWELLTPGRTENILLK